MILFYIHTFIHSLCIFVFSGILNILFDILVQEIDVKLMVRFCNLFLIIFKCCMLVTIIESSTFKSFCI